MNREAEGVGELHAHLFASYRQVAGAYDEALTPAGMCVRIGSPSSRAMNSYGPTSHVRRLPNA